MANSSPTLPLGSGIKVMTLIIQTNNNSIATSLLPIVGNSSIVLNKLENFLRQLGVGAWRSNTTIIQGGVYASGTATFASVVNTNTLVIGGVTITATNGTPTSTQFKVGANDTATAANAVTTINALTTLNKVVQASSVGAVVTSRHDWKLGDVKRRWRDDYRCRDVDGRHRRHDWNCGAWPLKRVDFCYL